MAPNPSLSRFVLAVMVAYVLFALGAWAAMRPAPRPRPATIRPAVAPRPLPRLPRLPRVLPPCGRLA
jgi:H+/Cl- antiporter ClcA